MTTNNMESQAYPWTAAGPEMALEDALDDQIVRLVMASDHLDYDEVVDLHRRAGRIFQQSLRLCGREVPIHIRH